MFKYLRRFLRKTGLKKPKKSFQEKYPQFQIGRGTHYTPRIYFAKFANLKVGAFSTFDPTVQIFLGGDHRYDWVTSNAIWNYLPGKACPEGHPKTKGDVTIGNDAYIATEAVIMSGVTIGDGAVIGARALVSRDIPPYAVAVGNPARVVKKRFDEETISRLLKIRWWDWDDDRIRKAFPLMMSDDIEAFLVAAEYNNI